MYTTIVYWYIECQPLTLQNVPDYDVEHSETLLYHVQVLEEMSNFADALSLLDINSKSRAIVDRTTIMETRGKSFNVCTTTSF